jgi:hypothetical protein
MEDSTAIQNLADDIRKRVAWSIFVGILTELLGMDAYSCKVALQFLLWQLGHSLACWC